MSNILEFLDDRRWFDTQAGSAQTTIDPSFLPSDSHEKRKATPDVRSPAWLNAKMLKSHMEATPFSGNGDGAGSDEGSVSGSSTSGKDSKSGSVSAAGRKPGRKLDPNEPETKRKAQNRAAQRAFRERKEKHLRDLEDRIKELENETTARNDENEFLKLQVSRLQTELKKYRSNKSASTGPAGAAVAATSPQVVSPESPEIKFSDGPGSGGPKSSFTFEFPFFGGAGTQPSHQSAKKTSIGNGASVAQSPALSPFSIKNSQSDNSPQSLTSSSTSPFTPFDTPGASGLSGFAGDRKSSKSSCNGEEFCDNLSLACGTKEHPFPADTKASKTSVGLGGSAADISGTGSHWETGSATQEVGPESQTGPTTGATAAATSNGGAGSSSVDQSLFSGASFDMDFLNSYRDPLFEQSEFNLPELATTEYSLFDPIESDPNMEPIPAPAKDEDDETVPAPNSKLLTCSAIWDRISAHPKFNDLDIDGLCSELRTKAKCSETGVLLTERDVDKVLGTIN